VSATAQDPGVHASVTVLAAAVPVQLCGPVNVRCPSLVTAPVKASKGGANASEQPVCVTMVVIPTSDASQCCVMVHVPATLGQEASELKPEPLLQPASRSIKQAYSRNIATSTVRELGGVVKTLTASPVAGGVCGVVEERIDVSAADG
jgi:hypothetical protein